MTRGNSSHPDSGRVAEIWRPEDKTATNPHRVDVQELYRPEIFNTITKEIEELDDELRALSLDIHDHPELAFQEHHTHDVLTAFTSKHGFQVTPHYILPTAWVATYTNGKGGRTIGINSEMDALKGIGHACGHNLIAISGVAVACAIKAAMNRWNISGTIILLGTPAEEGGNGKVILLEQGAYADMDVCLMCHPGPGPRGSVILSSSLAIERIEVEYFGHTAHAALSPWEGQNALDAAVLAYTNISALRQQIKPTHRIHGIFEGKDWAANIIPDYAKMTWFVRAPTRAELDEAIKRVTSCYEAAAIATACRIKIKMLGAHYDLRQNSTLGDEVANVVKSLGGFVDHDWGTSSSSTDFGNVTYVLPALHPGFSIPTEPNGGNHTPAFTKSARTIEAHNACLDISKALAATGVRVLADDSFFSKVQASFEADKKSREVS